MNWWHYYMELIGVAVMTLVVLIVIYVMVDAILAADAVMMP